MREIKFRAWDIEKKKMDTVSVLGINFGQGFLVRSGEGSSKDEFNLGARDDRFVLMQYTGLKDESGVPIYEGDIVMDKEKLLTVVSWEHSRWQFAHTDCAECYAINVGVKIVGNVYENPELIKDNATTT